MQTMEEHYDEDRSGYRCYDCGFVPICFGRLADSYRGDLMRWSAEDIRKLQKNAPAFRPAVAEHSKYRNVPTMVQDIRFASKKEAKHYTELQFMKAGGLIRGFTRQVSLPLASAKRRMVIDFMVVNLDGSIRWIDVKGVPTTAWLTKKDELEHSLGITIETL